MLPVNSNTCVIDLLNGPTSFRPAAVKPYYTTLQTQEKITHENDNVENVDANTKNIK